MWVGHAGDVRDVKALHAAGIQAVVTLAIEETPTSLPREFVSCRFPLIDGPGNPFWLCRLAIDTTAELIRSGVPTLIACGAGMSRSPGVAAMALSRVDRCTPDEALALLIQSGPLDISPGLWGDLQTT